MVVAPEPRSGHGRHRSATGLLRSLTPLVSERVDHEVDEPLFQRDPEYIRRQLSAVTRAVNLFSPEVRGGEHIPEAGPVLVVGNHSCLFFMPDVWMTALEVVRRRGVEQPAYALGYDLLFAVPGVGPFLRRIGTIPAGGPEAERALAQGALVLVYPGGDHEACRPWTARNTVDFGGHRGFVRLALRAGVPVVPVVTHGAHDAVVVIARGERLAHLLGLDPLRIKVLPIVLGPLGVAPVVTLPMPSAITVEFLPALDWRGYGPEAAGDETVLSQCYEQITDTMQAALDRLHAERSHPVLRGWWNLVHHGPRHLAVPAA
ncbi:MAG TPA: lysophospholipid acyltransferase family protein [Acidimicrobiales bacterium]|nr:lysophospholipid acyltransferase family protein [Acidimicrobiales bacterium]